MRDAMQVKEVVEYAARRFITVVPEIELPGHCGAALACYPHLSCKESNCLPVAILLPAEDTTHCLSVIC